MNSISTRPPSPVDALALEVFRGKCGSLTPTQKVIQVPLDLLDEPCRGYALQETKYDGIYWLLRNGQRHNNRCFCVFCRVKLNGLGSNLKMHSACHSDTRVYSQDQRNGAAFLFLIRHSVGFSTFRDPLVRIFLPQMSTATIEQLFTRANPGVRDLIRREVEKRDVTVMIDGWCDASLRRYLGVAVAYHCKAQNKIVHRFLDLGSGIAGRHTAQQLSTFLQKLLESFGLKSPQISCICSDSAATNPAVADLMSTNWMPCCVHLLNLVVQNFVNNSPVRLGKLLKKINKLRKKTLWIDFVGRSQSRNRNIAGYCPTRWCSVSTCLDSFLSFQELIMQFQGEYMKRDPMFVEDDFNFVASVIGLLRRFAEASDELSKADHAEGLATVFQLINAIYLVLCHAAEREWEFAPAVQQAQAEVEARFFNPESKFGCRLMFAGFLDVCHSLPKWLADRQTWLLQSLAEEIDMYTGEVLHDSQAEVHNERYSDDRPLTEIICDSPVSWDNSSLFDEIAHFNTSRQRYHGTSFMSFWSECTEYPQMQKYALVLRSFPTTTVWLERAFSIARRNLSWTRLHLSSEKASDICFLALNFKLVEVALGLGSVTDVISDEISTDIVESVDGDDFALDEEV